MHPMVAMLTMESMQTMATMGKPSITGHPTNVMITAPKCTIIITISEKKDFSSTTAPAFMEIL